MECAPMAECNHDNLKDMSMDLPSFLSPNILHIDFNTIQIDTLTLLQIRIIPQLEHY